MMHSTVVQYNQTAPLHTSASTSEVVLISAELQLLTVAARLRNDGSVIQSVHYRIRDGRTPFEPANQIEPGVFVTGIRKGRIKTTHIVLDFAHPTMHLPPDPKIG